MQWHYWGGAAFSAGITIPLEHIFNNSWTLAITMWAIPAGGAIVFWLFQSPKHIIKNHQTVPKVSGLWQCKLAWHITIFMVLQSMSSFTIFAWFALFLRDRGISSLEASLVVSISILLQTVASFVAPLIATKLKHQSWFNIAVVIMALIIFRSENTHVAAKLSSMVQTVGFGLGTFGPLSIGFVYRSPNHFLLVEVVFILIFLGLIYFGFKAGKDLYVSADVN